MIIEVTEPGDTGRRLDVFLAEALPELSRARLQTLIKQGHVQLGGKPTRPRHITRLGDRIDILIPSAEPPKVDPEDIPLCVLLEDDDILVVDKAPGMVVHPAVGNRSGTLVNALLHHCRGQLSGIGGVERPGIVHRLDKETSGCLVVAKNDQAHESLVRQFADRLVHKHYLAVVKGRPPHDRGRIENTIGRHPGNRRKMAVVASVKNGKPAVTEYACGATINGATRLDCYLLTGRTHQIRVHMHSLAHPILGDRIYGQGQGADRLLLHAWVLRFTHPASGEVIACTAPIPEAFHPWASEGAGPR